MIYWKLMSPTFFDKFGFHVKGKGIQACHCLINTDRAVVKFSNRKGSLPILCVKEDFKSLDLAECLCAVFFLFFFNWDSLHARLNSHYEARGCKKKKHKQVKIIQEICLERSYS